MFIWFCQIFLEKIITLYMTWKLKIYERAVSVGNLITLLK